MAQGGIEPSDEAYEMTCTHCGTLGANHVLEIDGGSYAEYMGLHSFCVKTYLKTERGKLFLAGAPDIYVLDERGVLVLEYSNGALIYDVAEEWS